MNALILFSHGSLLCGAGEALDAHAARLRARGGWDWVGVGYLNYSAPTFAESVAQAVQAGATRITVLPYFLVPGYFVLKSLPETVDAVRPDYPSVEFTIAPPLGKSDALVDALLLSAQTARPPGAWDDNLQRATRACKPSPTCPLFQTPECPKAPGDRPIKEDTE